MSDKMISKTILITGGTGFLGSHLIKYFVKKGYKIGVMKRESSDLCRLEGYTNKIDFFDVNDGLQKPFMQYKKIDIVMHTATCYGHNKETEQSIFETNVVFPMELLNLSIDYKVELFCNTDTYFNNPENSQQHLMHYTLSKRHFRDWLKLISINKELKICNLKLEHLFGRNDSENKFINRFIIQCLNNVTKIPLTFGNQKRDFIYIDDVVIAFDCILNNMHKLEKDFNEYGVGYGESISIRDFISMIHSAAKSTSILDFGALPLREGELEESYADNKTLKLLGWAPSYLLQDAINKTVSFYIDKDN